MRLPRNLCLTFRKAAPATKSILDCCALRKCCACHGLYLTAAPATKSILDLAKVLRLPRNSILAKPARGRANGHISEPVPGPFRDRSRTVPRPFRDRLRTGVATEAVCALSGSPIHAQCQHFCILLAVLHLPQNLYSTLRKCSPCQSAAPATQFNPCKTCARPRQWSHLRTRSETVPRPFRDRSGTVPRPPPYRRRDRGGLRTVRKPNSRTVPTFSASGHHPALLISAFIIAFFAHIHAS